MIEPIKPEEVKATATKPDEVIETFNELIKKYWDGERAVVPQREAVKMITERMGIDDKEIYRRRYLDIEFVYLRAGWKVEYDKPGYNENPYPAKFTFSAMPF